MFPVLLSLRGRPCLVVGGGSVALRKTRGLLDEEARVVVVAEEPCEELQRLAAEGRLDLRVRRYQSGEVAGHALVFAATDDRDVNKRVFDDADCLGIWVNVADDPPLCHFHLPARIRRGPLEITISTGGDAPFVSRRLRERLEPRLGPRWRDWIESAASFRDEVREAGLHGAAADAAFDRFVEETLDVDSLGVRVPTEFQRRAWLEGTPAGQTPRPGRASTGYVSLVGAGPGCPGLLTLRGRQRLLAADVVVYDRLAEPALPGDLPEWVELISVGKQAGNHPVPQHEINAMLVRLAKEGRRVVRFKGGDPYVFGRGGEEGEALRAAGIPFEVVPGVTSGVAVPGCVGVPVTSREEAVRLTLITAHESIKSQGPQISWPCLAKDKHATLVGYMGVSSLPNVSKNLIISGMDPATPAAIIERGSTSAQRSVVSTLEQLPGDAEREGIQPPALFVIGPTVRHSETLNWMADRPLAGRRVVVPQALAGAAEALELAGAEIVSLPVPCRPSARVVVDALPVDACVAHSPADVEAWHGLGLSRGDGPASLLIGLGQETAARGRELGWPETRELDGQLDDEALASQLVEALGARG
jgi:uroporphyrin-III C-methyltransferase/precorrin-2 dehydrogenase/sirohydrochlorin ferrochelatase